LPKKHQHQKQICKELLVKKKKKEKEPGKECSLKSQGRFCQDISGKKTKQPGSLEALQDDEAKNVWRQKNTQ